MRDANSLDRQPPPQQRAIFAVVAQPSAARYGYCGAAAKLMHMMALLCRHETVLYSALGVRPERRDAFCQALRTDVVREVMAAQPATMDHLQHIYHRGNQSQRFMGVNLENLWPKCLGTIEFRYFNATLDAAEIGCHVGS